MFFKYNKTQCNLVGYMYCINDEYACSCVCGELEGQMQQTEREVSIQLMDVNDNYPKLEKTQGFICVKTPKPLILTAKDRDAEPFGEPFTFSLQLERSSPNWEITAINGKRNA